VASKRDCFMQLLSWLVGWLISSPVRQHRYLNKASGVSSVRRPQWLPLLLECPVLCHSSLHSQHRTLQHTILCQYRRHACEIFPPAKPSQRNNSFFITLPSPSLCCTSQQLTSSTTPSSLPKDVPCFQPSFTRRTSGQCLRTFRAINLFCLQP
jgi:hypothetical protein